MMLEQYRNDERERGAQHLPPLPLTKIQVQELTALIEQGHDEAATLADLLDTRVEPGVSDGAEVKASWLGRVARGELVVPVISKERAVEMLSRMVGGYNVNVLIKLLDDGEMEDAAAEALKHITRIYDAFDRIKEKAASDATARSILESWAAADWFFKKSTLPSSLTFTVYKVDGEINTDDFSPGNQAQSRADIPLHATFFGHKRFPGGIEEIAAMRAQGKKVAFVGDVVGTGSSRKSAINSLVWHVGDDIPSVPNKRTGGIVIGATIAPIFYATARDAGVLPVQCDVSAFKTGDEVTLDLQAWTIATVTGETVALAPPPATLLEEYQAGGRLNLIIGKSLTKMACDALSLPVPAFRESENPQPEAGQAYTLAQKMIGRACGLPGVLPGTSCEPKISTVGSQDTTGPMTVQEIMELACLRFKADLVMQSFCHTAAYPKADDLGRWKLMTDTMVNCGGVALKPGDGVIHSWLNKMLLPDTVGTGGDSHTRFPMGISFPAGSGLVAFAAALGFMPLEMPESVLVRFTGKRRPGITVRDMVNAIPYEAIKRGLLTVEKKGKKNIFAGTILEIEGIDDLNALEAYELSDASAERNAAACALKLPLDTIVENVKKNILDLEALVDGGYEDSDCLIRRISAMHEWLAQPSLLRADEGAQYREVIEIDLDSITEPIVACPNDPDDVKLLSEVAGAVIDEAFVGSCMTHLSHMRRAVTLLKGCSYTESKLWVAPSTRLDRDAIQKEGGLAIFGQTGCRVEIPGCSLCMGNQGRVKPGATVISTSTRNFDNRLGDGAQVYLGSTELTTVAGILGRLPQVEEYFATLKDKGLV